MYKYKDSYGSSGTGGYKVLFVVLILCILVPIIFSIAEVNTRNTYEVTITDKSYSGDSDGYIIWAEDENGTQYEFTNKDKFICGKFNSGTIQGQLKEGYTYRITTIGWRIPLFSSYPNIIEYELISAN
jgi:hypothetical protein